MSEVQEVEMYLYFKTNLQNHNLDHHMKKCFHKPVLNTLLINILNQNRLQVSQQKKIKKKNKKVYKFLTQIISRSYCQTS